MKTVLTTATALLVQLQITVQAADWSQFRGPNGDSSLETLEHATSWDQSTNLAWSRELAGGGWSSPVVSGGRIYVTTAVGKNLTPKGFSAGVASMRSFFGKSGQSVGQISYQVHCLSLADGKPLWAKTIIKATPPHRVHPSNTYATESPVAAGGHVYAYFATIGVVVCLNEQGEEVWRRDVGAWPTSSSFGTGSSLAFDRGRLFLQCDNQEKSFLLTLNAENGEPLWRADRPGRTSWSSPLVWVNRVRTELVACGSDGVTSYDPETGKVIWRMTGIGGSFSSTPASDENRIYFGNSGPGRSGPLVAVRAGASGEFTPQQKVTANSDVAWVQRNSGPGLASPVSDGDLLYVTGRGILSAYDVTTGERVYRTRLQGSSSIAASPWVAGDRLFILDESGNTHMVQTGREFKLIATNSLSDLFWSTPSVAGKALLLRGTEALYCIRAEQELQRNAATTQ